ncbi:MAG: serine/threonine-protein kinase [Solirubrobacterales bacterium]
MSELGPDFAGRYRIEEKIGQGGMGAVYRAFDLQLERPVALKVLTDTAAEDPAARSRFYKEISLTASLTHLYIVPVYDGGIEEGRFYFTMELIEGSDLGQLCATGPMEPKRSIRLLRQVCAALQFIHEKGYVHRDVKPTNVLVWEPGDEWESAKLADFGIARALAEDSNLTKAPPGSLAYMSPEGIEWQPQTPLSDQYALGVMAFELLCGRRPFADEDLPRAHCDKLAPNPAEFVPGLPAATCAAIERALAKDPSDRFADVATFASALEAESTVPTPGPTEEVATESESVSLTDEIVVVLSEIGGWVQVEELSRRINSRGHYPLEVGPEDVDRRTTTFSRRFRRKGSAVRLRES